MTDDKTTDTKKAIDGFWMTVVILVLFVVAVAIAIAVGT